MSHAVRSSHRIRRATSAAVLGAALLAGCQVSKPPVPPATYAQTVTSGMGGSGQLINEGGTVFLQGTVEASGLKSNLTALTVNATQLDGTALSDASPAPVASDGSFTLQIHSATTSQLIFAVCNLQPAGVNGTVRTLARVQAGDPLVLDPASSLVAAQVATAAKSRALDGLSYTDTAELTAQVRADLGSTLASVDLTQGDQALATQLNSLSQQNPGLADRLSTWQGELQPPPSPSPLPSPKATATASPSPSASNTASPVK